MIGSFLSDVGFEIFLRSWPNRGWSRQAAIALIGAADGFVARPVLVSTGFIVG